MSNESEDSQNLSHHSNSDNEIEPTNTNQVEKSKIKIEQVQKLLNKFKSKTVEISHILQDLEKYDIENFMEEVSHAFVEHIIQDQSEKIMLDVVSLDLQDHISPICQFRAPCIIKPNI